MRMRAATLWFTGLPCSGKTTLAEQVAKELSRRGHPVERLDGDAIRKNLSNDLGFSKQDRLANINRVAFVADLLTRQGVFTIVSLVSPYREMRDSARATIAEFIEIYVRCPLSVCEKRDVKGMYKLARQGKIQNFTGVSDPYEEPEDPEITLDTDKHSISECAAQVIRYLTEQGRLLPQNPFPKDALVSKAFTLAAGHHHGQKRKGGLPYITHPISVAHALREAGHDSETVAAGLLHDVLEDTGCEREEIERVAGPKVARIVCEVTDKDKTVSWSARKSNYLRNLKKASKPALAVACADKADNLRGLVDGLSGGGTDFARLFSGKMKARVAHYKKILSHIRSRRGDCPLVRDYELQLERFNELVRKTKGAVKQ